MFKQCLRLMFIGSLSMLTTGCMVFGFTTVKAIPLGGPPPNPPAPAQAPVIHLEYAGNAVDGIEGSFGWHTANSASNGMGWSGTWPPSFPSTLTAQVGKNVDIAINYGQPPAALWGAELNSRGIPTTSAALAPTTNVT